jgi:hypothetical protein
VKNETESLVAFLVVLVCTIGIGLLMSGSETGAFVCLGTSAILVTGGTIAIMIRGRR